MIYVAAAQRYKRHDILLDAFARLPRTSAASASSAMARMPRRSAPKSPTARLNIVCIGPPGVNHSQVNALMNRARIGVVCGEDDGAPAILTEYMLAGLPVLANERLRCGLDFIRPDTGLAAPAEAFAEASSSCSPGRRRWRPATWSSNTGLGRERLNDLRPTSIRRAGANAQHDGDLICFSHLRWDFVCQRPQHLMERFRAAAAGDLRRGADPDHPPSALPRVPRLRRHRASPRSGRASPTAPARRRASGSSPASSTR